MIVDLSKFQREAAYLNEIMADGLWRLQFGSYADRHPGLGKMTKCSLCGRRRRELPLEPCCNTSHATTQRAWTPEIGFHQIEHKEWDETAKDYIPKPRVVEALIGKAFFKKFTYKRHSNKLRHQIHDLIIQLQDESFRNAMQFLLEGLPGFWEPKQGINIAHIPTFAERLVRYKRKYKAKVKRKNQKISRRINRGLM